MNTPTLTTHVVAFTPARSLWRSGPLAEVALALLMENGGRGRYTLTGNALAVSGTERVNGLRVIAPGRFRRLAISDAWEIDWMGLSNQEFDDVDFSGSRLSTIPDSSP